MASRETKKEKPQDARGALRRLAAYLMDYRAALAAILLLVIAGNILSLLGPSLAGRAISAAGAGRGQVDFAVVYRSAGAMLACCLGSSLLTVGVKIGRAHV